MVRNLDRRLILLMIYQASLEFVLAVRSALSRSAAPSLRPMDSWAEKVIADGWVLLTELSSIMEAQDPRFYALERHMEAACVAFELPIRYAASKPRNHHSEFVLFQSLDAVDAAAFMVHFQRLGFEVDPSVLIDRLIPKLAEHKLFSLAQIDVMQHSKTVGRCCVSMRTSAAPQHGPTEKSRTSSGYRVQWNARGELASIEVRGPRYKKPQQHAEQRCTYCNFLYTPGNLDSSLDHRREHHRHQHVFDPKPLLVFARHQARSDQADVITSKSPKWAHREMYERAIMFKREMRYDFPQWSFPPTQGRPTERCTGYFLADPASPSTIAGACAFRLRGDRWTMDWAWLAPKYRRSGIMQRHWPRFVAAYGDFPLEFPLSEAMQAFVLHHGTAGQQYELRSMGIVG